MHYICFYLFSWSLTAIWLCWNAALFWKPIFSHLSCKILLCDPVAQILPLYQRKETAVNSYCTSPFPRSRELKENNCCCAAKLEALCKLGIGALQLSDLQGWLFKGLVKLILHQFPSMDFPLSGEFNPIKCFSIARVHWKRTAQQTSGWQGVYTGSSRNNGLRSVICKRYIPIKKPSQGRDIPLSSQKVPHCCYWCIRF